MTFAVSAGGATYVDADAEVYEADAGFSSEQTNKTTAAIAGTMDDFLYLSERYGDFSYNIPVHRGDYKVTLKFAEIYWMSTGKRVLNVLIEGKTVISKARIGGQSGPKDCL